MLSFSNFRPVTCGEKLHNSESYQAGLFIAAPGARGIASPNLHTESRRMHLFITKLISVGWALVIISRNSLSYSTLL